MTYASRYISRILTGALALISLFLVFVMFQMVRPYDINDVKSLTVPPVVTRGQVAVYQLYRCKLANNAGQVDVSIVDGNSYKLFSMDVSTAMGCGVVLRDFTVPNFLPPGTYHLEWAVHYHPNIFRTITYRANSNNFELK